MPARRVPGRTVRRIGFPGQDHQAKVNRACQRRCFEKVWNRHVVSATDEATLLYIDRHLVHEVTSPQAFEGLRLAGRRVRRPDLTFATLDHNVPTENQLDIRDPLSRRQVETLRANCREFGITLYDIKSGRQGIVHVIGPELGLTLPGLTIVCGDSHTSTHGAFGALAFGIGTSEVEHVLATQTLWQGRAAAVARHRGDRPAARRASSPRTSSWPSSARSAPAGAPGTSSSTTARRSRPCRWKGG